MSVRFDDPVRFTDLANFAHFSKLENLKFDVDLMKQDYEKLVSQFPLEEATHQLCLTHRKETPDDELFYDGCGSLTYKWSKDPYTESGELKKREVKLFDSDFTEFNSAAKETYFFEIYQALSKLYNVGRFRFMLMHPKKCISWHTDTETRCHMAIVTSTSCRMVIENESIHIPDDGFPYICDTLKFHTAFNGSHKCKRVHLVVGLHGSKD